MLRRSTVPWVLAPIAVAVAFLATACGGGESDAEVADLRSQLAEARGDSKYWQQLTSVMEPVELPSMTDHRAYMLPSSARPPLRRHGLGPGEEPDWVALGVPGTFCKKDQQRVEKEFGSGFTHFHDLEADTHGGKPGAEGVWFVHVSVRDFQSPMSTGPVTGGEVDHGFMPTPPPSCA